MYLLDYIVTDKTPVITLEDVKISKNDKANILIDGCKYKDLLLYEKKYLDMIKKYNGELYFLKDSFNISAGYDAMNEFLGSYLAQSIDLDTVKYDVVKDGINYGIASKSFKKPKCKYYYPEKLSDRFNFLSDDNIANVKFIEALCSSKDEKEKIIDQFCKITALDIYMMQTDRNGHNIQFKVDENEKLSFAPLYDYSFSFNNMDDMRNFYVTSPFVVFRTTNDFKILMKKYPAIREYLELLMKYDIRDYIDDIFDDYAFNKKDIEYEDVTEYYNRKNLIYKDFLRRNIL